MFGYNLQVGYGIMVSSRSRWNCDVRESAACYRTIASASKVDQARSPVGMETILQFVSGPLQGHLTGWEV